MGGNRRSDVGLFFREPHVSFLARSEHFNYKESHTKTFRRQPAFAWVHQNKGRVQGDGFLSALVSSPPSQSQKWNVKVSIYNVGEPTEDHSEENLCYWHSWLLFNNNEFTHPLAWRPLNTFFFREKSAQQINSRNTTMEQAVCGLILGLSLCLNGRKMEINLRLTQVHAPSGQKKRRGGILIRRRLERKENIKRRSIGGIINFRS